MALLIAESQLCYEVGRGILKAKLHPPPSSGPQLNMRGQDKHTLPLHPKAGAFTA